MGDLIKREIQNELWVIPHIQKIAIKTDQPELTREVIEACHKKQAFLFLSRKGFVIVQPKIEHGIKRLLLWVAWRNESGVEIPTNELADFGRSIGVSELEFWTKRKGFARLGPKLGFSMREVKNGFFIWRKSV